MNLHKMKKIIWTICLSLCLVTGLAVPVHGLSPTEHQGGADLFTLNPMGNFQGFSNHAAGYSLTVDAGMKVDMRYPEVYTAFENDHKRIEIYQQKLDASLGKSAYINYSNRFLDNRTDHRKEYEAITYINGKEVRILQWSRDKLARVKNDKNYYVSLEISADARTVYTIIAKSDQPFHLTGGYNYLYESFTVIEATQIAYHQNAAPLNIDEKNWNQETKDLFRNYFSPESHLQWGIFEPATPHDFNQLKSLEEAMDYEFPFILNYTNIENRPEHPDLAFRLANAYKEDKIVELTLQTTWTGANQSNMVYGVLQGEYDEFLRDYAKTVSDFGHPVLFRLGNEMNGDWCPYSSYNTAKDTMVFKEFYRYIYGLFEEAGADNVIWVWNPNGKSFPDFQWNNAVMYYPGDEYVDIVGLTAYNTGTYYPGESWNTFQDLYDPLYAEYMRLYGNKPMMITEFASSSVGGNKNQWIRDMFGHIGNYPNIKVAIWWDGCDWDSQGNIARPYFIDETPELLETFREFLRGSASTLPTAQAVYW